MGNTGHPAAICGHKFLTCGIRAEGTDKLKTCPHGGSEGTDKLKTCPHGGSEGTDKLQTCPHGGASHPA